MKRSCRGERDSSSRRKIFFESFTGCNKGFDTIENFEPGAAMATCDVSRDSQEGVGYKFDIDRILEAASALEDPGTPEGEYPNSQRIIASGAYVMMKTVDIFQRTRGLRLRRRFASLGGC